MNLVSHKSNIIEQIIRDGEGRLVRATFSVYESYGRIKGRLISAVVIEENEGSSIGNIVLQIGGFISRVFAPIEVIFETACILPHLNNSLYFSGSQPRAPTENF